MNSMDHSRIQAQRHPQKDHICSIQATTPTHNISNTTRNLQNKHFFYNYSFIIVDVGGIRPTLMKSI